MPIISIYRSFRWQSYLIYFELKLEIDEGLEVGGDELINNKDSNNDNGKHEPQRHACKPDAIATFEIGGKPVDNHSDSKHNEYPTIVGDDFGNLR